MARRGVPATATRVGSLTLLGVSIVGAASDLFIVGLVSFALVGAVIVWRRPGNVIGWLLVAIGSMPAVSHVAPSGGGDTAFAAAGRIVQQLNSAAFGLVVFLVLLFPSGRLPSPRWRWPARVAGGSIAFIALMGVLRTDTGDTHNPLGVKAFQPVVDLAFAPTASLLVAVGVAALVNVFIRMHRASGDERAQLRWFASGTAVFPALMLVNGASQDQSWQGAVLLSGFIIGLTAIAAGIGVAVLKYHLYAIDVVINKALVYGSLAAFITAIYVGVVVAAGQLVNAASSDRRDVVLSLVATTIVAVTFHRARERFQRVANRLVYGQRLSPYEAVASFAHRVAASLSFDHVLREMAEVAALSVGASRSRVRLLLPGGGEEAAHWPSDAPADVFDRVVPVMRDGETLGDIAIAKGRGEQLTKQDDALLHDVAFGAVMAMSTLRLTEELKQRLVDLQDSRRRLVAAQDEERRRMERDLHDGAQQQLVAMKIKLGLAKALLAGDGPAQVHQMLDDLTEDASAAVATLRDLARGLFPEVLVQRGLVAAIAAHVQKSGLRAEVHAPEDVGRYDLGIESNVYFVVREALQNASKYAPGAGVTITLAEADGSFSFEIADDGPGFDPRSAKAGSGTQNMRDRMDALGGNLEVTSAPGGGTAIRGCVPLTAPAPAVMLSPAT